MRHSPNLGLGLPGERTQKLLAHFCRVVSFIKEQIPTLPPHAPKAARIDEALDAAFRYDFEKAIGILDQFGNSSRSFLPQLDAVTDLLSELGARPRLATEIRSRRLADYLRRAGERAREELDDLSFFTRPHLFLTEQEQTSLAWRHGLRQGRRDAREQRIRCGLTPDPDLGVYEIAHDTYGRIYVITSDLREPFGGFSACTRERAAADADISSGQIVRYSPLHPGAFDDVRDAIAVVHDQLCIVFDSWLGTAEDRLLGIANERQCAAALRECSMLLDTRLSDERVAQIGDALVKRNIPALSGFDSVLSLAQSNVSPAGISADQLRFPTHSDILAARRGSTDARVVATFPPATFAAQNSLHAYVTLLVRPSAVGPRWALVWHSEDATPGDTISAASLATLAERMHAPTYS